MATCGFAGVIAAAPDALGVFPVTRRRTAIVSTIAVFAAVGVLFTTTGVPSALSAAASFTAAFFVASGVPFTTADVS